MRFVWNNCCILMLITSLVVFGAGLWSGKTFADSKEDIAATEAFLAEKDAEREKQLKQAQDDLTATKKQVEKLRKQANKSSAQQDELKRLRLQVSSLQKRVKALEAENKALKDNHAQTPSPAPAPTPKLTPSAPAPAAYAWHPSAKSQITNWKFQPGDRAVVLTIMFKNGKIVEVKAPKTQKGQDEYFLAKKLPAGLQVVLPGDEIETWVINCDNRPGFVKMIQDPSDIAASGLSDANDHKEGNGKTFRSGEAIILVEQAGMTIRPPVY